MVTAMNNVPDIKQSGVTAVTLDRVKRLTRLQRALLAHMAEYGGEHIYLSPCSKAIGHLSGYTWAGVNLSLQSLLRAGLIQLYR